MKRTFEFLLSLIVIVFLLPFYMIIFLYILFGYGPPVLFKQTRPGLNANLFTLYKFRTMTLKRDANGKLMPDAERLTNFGQFLRSTSLDELPELWNVLNGDMSLVGPRPLLTEYLPLYSKDQMRRHEVRPGITGWAQVNGRNALTWEEKFKRDVWYVDHQSFWLDIKILLMTVKKVLMREGISAKEDATMPVFKGN
jgi:lipopolysaccharide/colanic/teichoic acid biosynthesis glycosyltransferase